MTEIKAPQPAPATWTLTGETDGWMASHDGIGSSEYRAVKDAAGTVVALVVAQSEEHWADLDTETPGRLIAAAPELLAALQTARDCIELDRIGLADCHMNPHTNQLDADGQAGCDEYDAVLAQIDAAIAKATGEPA